MSTWALILTAVLVAFAGMIILRSYQFLDAMKLLNDKTTVFDSSDADFDIFISYKSHNVFLVRRIAEMLLSQGLRVWFAEYVIRLKERHLFESQIKNGISRTKYGLVFLTEQFNYSPHCCEEVKLLLKHLRPENILLVYLEEGELMGPDLPSLSSIPIENRVVATPECIPHFKSCVEYVVEFVHEVTQLPVEGCKQLAMQFYHEVAKEEPKSSLGTLVMGTQFEVNTSGWTEIAPEQGSLKPDDYVGPVFQRKILGVRTKLRVGVWKDTSSTDLHYEHQANVDDRSLYDSLVFAFNRYMNKQNRRRGDRGSMECIGAHLFAHQGLNHLSLSYWNVDCWVRRYLIMLPLSKQCDNVPFEISVHFEFYGSFPLFCAAALLFESTAASVRWN